MAEIRRELSALPWRGETDGSADEAAKRTDAAPVPSGRPAPGRARVPFDASPHLVFFLHDEVIVHTPAAQADVVAQIIVSAAETAGRLLFGDFPVDFMLTVATVDNYAQAK